MTELSHKQLTLLADDIDAARRVLSGEASAEGSLLALAIAPVWAAPRALEASPWSEATHNYVDTPCRLQAVTEMARRAQQNGYWLAAIAFWQRALRVTDVFDLCAERPEIHRELGLLLSRVGEVGMAARHFDQASPQEFGFMEQILVGHAHIELGEMAKAQVAFRRAKRAAVSAAEIAQVVPFLHPRLLEFEGQSGGLGARDLHYVQTGGLLLLTSAPGKSSEYHGELRVNDELVAMALDRLVRVLVELNRRPTCVVPANNDASPLSLAIAEMLGIPHFSHQRSISWDRPLVVLPHMNRFSARCWQDFLNAMPGVPTTFAFGHDWTDDALPIADITGLLASRCHFDSSAEGPAPTVRTARRLVEATRQFLASPTVDLDHYYLAHGAHRLTSPTPARVAA